MSNQSNELPHDKPESGDLRYEPILEQLGFKITPELVEITSALRIALADDTFDPEALKQLWTEYALRSEALIDRIDDPDMRLKAQIGAIAHKAFLFRDAGRILRYLEELTQAEIYAGSAAYDPENPEIPKDIALYTLSKILSAEINRRGAELEPSPECLIIKLRRYLSDSNQLYLWQLWAEEQDYKKLVNHAHEMLLDEGEDADEILQKLSILEP